MEENNIYTYGYSHYNNNNNNNNRPNIYIRNYNNSNKYTSPSRKYNSSRNNNNSNKYISPSRKYNSTRNYKNSNKYTSPSRKYYNSNKYTSPSRKYNSSRNYNSSRKHNSSNKYISPPRKYKNSRNNNNFRKPYHHPKERYHYNNYEKKMTYEKSNKGTYLGDRFHKDKDLAKELKIIFQKILQEHQMEYKLYGKKHLADHKVAWNTKGTENRITHEHLFLLSILRAAIDKTKYKNLKIHDAVKKGLDYDAAFKDFLNEFIEKIKKKYNDQVITLNFEGLYSCYSVQPAGRRKGDMELRLVNIRLNENGKIDYDFDCGFEKVKSCEIKMELNQDLTTFKDTLKQKIIKENILGSKYYRAEGLVVEVLAENEKDIYIEQQQKCINIWNDYIYPLIKDLKRISKENDFTSEKFLLKCNNLHEMLTMYKLELFALFPNNNFGKFKNYCDKFSKKFDGEWNKLHLLKLGLRSVLTNHVMIYYFDKNRRNRPRYAEDGSYFRGVAFVGKKLDYIGLRMADTLNNDIYEKYLKGKKVIIRATKKYDGQTMGLVLRPKGTNMKKEEITIEKKDLPCIMSFKIKSTGFWRVFISLSRNATREDIVKIAGIYNMDPDMVTSYKFGYGDYIPSWIRAYFGRLNKIIENNYQKYYKLYKINEEEALEGFRTMGYKFDPNISNYQNKLISIIGWYQEHCDEILSKFVELRECIDQIMEQKPKEN